MNLFNIFVIGFALGMFVSGLAFLTAIGRYKMEALWTSTKLCSARRRLIQAEKQTAIMRKGFSDTNAENDHLKSEVDRLRDQKLRAWDIPDGL